MSRLWWHLSVCDKIFSKTYSNHCFEFHLRLRYHRHCHHLTPRRMTISQDLLQNWQQHSDTVTDRPPAAVPVEAQERTERLT